MKKILLLLISVLSMLPALAQENLTDKDKLISAFVSCFTAKSTAEVEPLLSKDFTMLEHKMPVSLKILQSMTSSLNDNIDSVAYISTTSNGSETAIAYDIFFSSKKRMVTFHLNPQGKVREIVLEGVGAKVQKVNDMATLNMENAPNIVQIPFTLYKTLPIVKVKVNGEELNFFFDSGAPTIILNKVYHGGGKAIVGTAKGVSGQDISSDMQAIAEFEFAGMKANSMDVMVMDLSQLEENKDEKEKIAIHGLIGYSAIKDFDIMYSYEEQIITLIKKDFTTQFIDELRANGAVENEVPLKQVNHIPYIPVHIAANEYLMGIDCGASMNLFCSTKLDEIRGSVTELETTTLVGGDTKGVERESGKVSEMTIGGVSFANVPTVFSDRSHLKHSMGIDLAGLVGYPILSKQKCIVSYHTAKLIFLK